MPIRPETRHLYPPDWKQIRARILRRAANRCETCGRPNGVEVYVWDDGTWHDPRGHEYSDALGRPIEPRSITPSCCDRVPWHIVRTVLTIAHLDHDPTHNADDNLRAWCQRCHLIWDAKHHASNARRTRARKAGQGELPGV